MDLNNFKLILSILSLFFGYSNTQDHSNYFFQSQPQHPGRFIPSPSFPQQYQPPPQRNSFFPSGPTLPDQNSPFHHSNNNLGQHQQQQQKIINQNHNINNNHNSGGSSGSYHEQFLYLSDDATTPTLQSSPFQFSQFQPTRSPDYFDFPQRVFGGNSPQSVVPLGQSPVPPPPPPPLLSVQPSFTRAQAIRPNGSTGFIIPQKPNNNGIQSQSNLNRNQNNSLKQQNQFLPQQLDKQQEQQQQNFFLPSKSEESIIVKPTTNQPNRSNSNQFNKFNNNNNNQLKNKPFTSNRLKSTSSAETGQKQSFSDEIVDPNTRQQLPFKTSRSRFQPNTRTTTTATSLITEVQSHAEKSKSATRFNNNNNGSRTTLIFQKNQSKNLSSSSQSKTNQNLSFSPQRSRFSSSSASSSNSNSLKSNQNIPKRTVFISREPNEPIHSKSQNRITINHNGSDKNTQTNEFNAKFGQKMNVSQSFQNDYDILNEEFMKPLERLPLKENVVTTTTSSSIESNLNDKNTEELSEDKNTVILTSNFYLPAGNNNSEDSDDLDGSDLNDSKKNYDYSSTSKPLEYDYEYEDYDEQVETESPSIMKQEFETEPRHEKAIDLIANISTEQNSFVHATTFRRNFDKLTENPLSSRVSPTPDVVINENKENDFPPETEPNTEEPSTMTDKPTTIENVNVLPSTTEKSDQKNSSSSVDDDDEEDLFDYEDEYEDLDGSGEYPEEENTQQKPVDLNNENKQINQQLISVVTTKSVTNGSSTSTHPAAEEETLNLSTESNENVTKTPETADNVSSSEKTTEKIQSTSVESTKQNTSEINNKSEVEVPTTTTTTENNKKNQKDEILNNSTEGYVVIASIQTSRSINGARFLPFPAIEQEEKKQPFSELEKKIHGPKTKTTKKSAISKDQNFESNERITSKDVLPQDTTTTTSTALPTTLSSNTDSPIEMTTLPSLENLFSKTVPANNSNQNQKSENNTDKFPIINMDGPILTTSITKFVPNIKKFVPKSTTLKPKLNIEDTASEEISSFLPSDYKQRTNSYLNKKKSTTTESPDVSNDKSNRSADSIGRSIKNYSSNQDIVLTQLLPKGYKLNEPTTETSAILKDILSKIKFEEVQEKTSTKSDHNDKNQKGNHKSTSKPYKTTLEDVSKYLPAGFNKFKLPPSQTTTTKKPSSIVPQKEDLSSSLLPSGYKLKFSDKYPTTTKKIPIENEKFVPAGFKLFDKDDDVEMIDISKLFMNEKSMKMKNNSSPSHHVFEAQDEEELRLKNKQNEGSKIVYPKPVNKRPPRPTVIAPPVVENGPALPPITIKKGPPMRATTEFTGWPTPSTTPISIEKLLEQSKIAKFDIFEYLSTTSSSSTTTTTTTTTTTPQPPKPTQPGLCLYECDLAATIKIVDGVQWRPELLDHNTLEWKNLAKEIEIQLNEVYKNDDMLSRWYKKIRIDSFNKGSVLVDYFVELSNITENVNTLELKRLFHNALEQTPLTIIPSSNDDNYDEYREGKGEKLVKETFMLGRFIVDPLSTDFIVIPKSQFPDVEYTEPLVPQWAIVLIVIGVGSLVFIVIFGVTVLINRHKHSKKTPTALTADMLNELNKNHMGGVDNYGAEDFYNVEDTWNENKQPIKPKRLSNSINGSSQTNIYDSWGSNHNHGDYFYNEQKDYIENDPYHQQQTHPHYKITNPYSTDPVWDAHQMYTYNTRPRYHRDHYDPDF